MASEFKKASIYLRGNSVPVDKRFLDALALMRLGKLYDCDETKKKTREILRGLVGPGDKIHPQDVHFIILKSILPKNKLALI